MAITTAHYLSADEGRPPWRRAADVLEQATTSGQVAAAVLHVRQGDEVFTRSFGKAASGDAMFLLGSISKPIAIAALMTLYDQGLFRLDDLVRKHLSAFTGEGRDEVTIQHLLTHVSGLPDQLAKNNELRRQHAPLDRFVEETLRTPLSFQPGSRYQYSSMAILLAARIAELLSGKEIRTLVEERVLRPLGMQHSAQGVGQFKLADLVPLQMEGAAPESGAGDPTAKEWDWNSPYWRRLGAPWGGTHASAPDVGRFLHAFLRPPKEWLRPETARLMTTNHNRRGLPGRGLGFAAGPGTGSPGTSDVTFGHTGSTGQLCWADPQRDLVCVVLTSLPALAANPHPRELAGREVAMDRD